MGFKRRYVWLGGFLFGLQAMMAGCGNSSSSTPTSVAGAGSSGGPETGGSGAASRAGSAAGGAATGDGGSEQGGAGDGGAGDGGAGDGGAGDGGEPVITAGAGGESPSIEEGDPLPIEPNLDGLVPHSTQWLLFKRSTSTSSYTSDIQLLDLATNQLLAANPGGPLDVLGGLSPDARTYFFSNSDGSKPSARIIRLEPDGFVPAKQLEGYVGVAGAYRVLSWSFDSRFAVVSRGAGQSTVEIIDMRLGTRIATEQFSSIVGEFAPKGYHYYYDAAQVEGFQPKHARVTQAGSTSAISLPPDAKHMVFDPSGTQLFYALGVYPASDKLFLVSLVDGKEREISVAEPAEFFGASDALPVAGDSVVVTVGEAQTSSVRRRVFLDGNKPSVTLTPPELRVSRFAHSADNNLYAVKYTSSSQLELMQVEPYLRQPLPAAWVPSSSWDNLGFIGSHAYAAVSDGLHLARFDGGQVDEVVLGAGQPARACASDFRYTPLHKLAFLRGDGAELVFVDLDATPPAIRASVQPSAAGFKLACPVWGDHDTAIAFTESNATDANTYVTRWTSAAPETPVLARTGLGPVLAVMYR